MTSYPRNVLAALWRAAGQPEAALEAIELTGAEPVLPSSFAVGTAAQASIAAAALAAAARQCRHARCSDRVPQRALPACRWRARARAMGQDRGPLPLWGRKVGAASHQSAAPSRRIARIARLRA